MWLLAPSVALGQAVADVPMGARAVTVFACPRDCDAPYRAISAWAAAQRLPLLDFDAVALHSRDDRLQRWDTAMGPVRAGTASRGEVEAAWRATEDLPYTVSEDDLVRLVLALAEVALTADTPRYIDHDWVKVAASVSRHRTYNLPSINTTLLGLYLDRAAEPIHEATVDVSADAPGAVLYVDGRPAGALPLSVPLEIGTHRLSVERPGRRTAWVAWIEVSDSTAVVAEVAGDDSNAALERVVLAAITGTTPPDAEVATLTHWARSESLEWVRFVQVGHEGDDELLRVEPGDPAWRTADVYLDVARGRLVAEGPGPNAMLAAADPERFRVGAALGYLHLSPRDHLAVDLAAAYRLGPWWAVEARLGLAHSAQPYYLYEDWIDPQVYPLSLGLRAGDARGGPFAAAEALAVIPYALGAQARVGWEFAPSLSWRVGVEARGGITDRGWLAGGGVSLAARR